MNWLIGAMLMILSTLVGYATAHAYKKSYTFINDFCSFLQFLESNCAFLQDSLKNILENCKAMYNTDFNAFLTGLYQNLDSKEEYLNNWKNSQKIISKDEATKICDFFSQFGRLDCDTQISAIKSSAENFAKVKQVWGEKVNKKGSLTTKLGLVCGVALFIIVL